MTDVEMIKLLFMFFGAGLALIVTYLTGYQDAKKEAEWKEGEALRQQLLYVYGVHKGKLMKGDEYEMEDVKYIIENGNGEVVERGITFDDVATKLMELFNQEPDEIFTVYQDRVIEDD